MSTYVAHTYNSEASTVYYENDTFEKTCYFKRSLTMSVAITRRKIVSQPLSHNAVNSVTTQASQCDPGTITETSLKEHASVPARARGLPVSYLCVLRRRE